MSVPSNDQNSRKIIIPIRYPTPSRAQIVIVVSQLRDDLGRWMVPVIVFEGPLGPFLESGRYARDLGVAFIVASHFYAAMMLDVKKEYLGHE